MKNTNYVESLSRKFAYFCFLQGGLRPLAQEGGRLDLVRKAADLQYYLRPMMQFLTESVLAPKAYNTALGWGLNLL